MKKSLAWLAIAAGVLSLESSPNAAVRLLIPSQDAGPPFYASLDRPSAGQIFQDGVWAAIPFLRDTRCVSATPTCSLRSTRERSSVR